MRTDLTDEERQLLTDPRALAKAMLRGPLVLESRTVTGLRVPDLLLDRAVFRDVAFEEVTFEGTRFRGARLEEVAFNGCQVRSTGFEGCELRRVSVEEGSIREARLERCQVVALSTVAAQLDGGSVEACEFDGWKDDHLTCQGTSFAKTRFLRPQWKETRFGDSALSDVTVEGGRSEGASFTECKLRRAAFRGMELKGLDFLFGELAEVDLDDLRGGSLGLADLGCDGVRIRGSKLAGLTLSAVKGRGLSIEGCPQVQMLMVMYGKLDGLRIADSTLDGPSLRQSTVRGATVVERCRLLGLDLEQSTFDELTLREVAVEGKLYATGARLGRLTLERLQYGADYQLEDAGAVYGTAARFERR